MVFSCVQARGKRRSNALSSCLGHGEFALLEEHSDCSSCSSKDRIFLMIWREVVAPLSLQREEVSWKKSTLGAIVKKNLS